MLAIAIDRISKQIVLAYLAPMGVKTALPGVLSWVFCQILRKWGWIKEGDLKLEM